MTFHQNFSLAAEVLDDQTAIGSSVPGAGTSTQGSHANNAMHLVRDNRCQPFEFVPCKWLISFGIQYMFLICFNVCVCCLLSYKMEKHGKTMCNDLVISRLPHYPKARSPVNGYDVKTPKHLGSLTTYRGTRVFNAIQRASCVLLAKGKRNGRFAQQCSRLYLRAKEISTIYRKSINSSYHSYQLLQVYGKSQKLFTQFKQTNHKKIIRHVVHSSYDHNSPTTSPGRSTTGYPQT